MLHLLLTTKLLPMLFAGVGFGLLVTVHEFGHFIFCKIFGVRTPIFSIGFGPRIIHRMIGDTEFRLSLIPLGGYCAIQDYEEEDLPELANAPEFKVSESFSAQSYIKKLLIMIGGIAFNLMFAYGTFTALHLGTLPKMQGEIEITHTVPGSVAHTHGFEKGAHLTHWAQGEESHTLAGTPQDVREALSEMLSAIANNPGKVLSFTYRSPHGPQHTRSVELGTNADGTGSLGIGIALNEQAIPHEYEHNTLLQALYKGIEQTHYYLKATANSLASLFTRHSLNGLGGPIAIFSETFKSAQKGFRTLLNLLGCLSIGLALTNLLPLGALDGGQIAFVTIEAFIRRRLPSKLKEWINNILWGVFLLLVLALSYGDIIKLVS